MEIWLDLSCPWCYGALPVLRGLLSDPITWRFVRLRPMPAEGMAYQLDPEVIEYNAVRQRPVRPRSWLHHPQLAHRLLVLARDYPVDDMWELAESTWRAHWWEGADLSTLAGLKTALSLPDPIWAALEAEGGQAQLEADRQRAHEIGLDGVPRISLNGRIIPAWHEPAQVAANFEAARAESS